MSFGDFLSAPLKAMRFARGPVLGAPVLLTVFSVAVMLVAMWSYFGDPALAILPAGDVPASLSGLTIVLGIIALASIFATDVLAGAFVAPGVSRAVMGEKLSVGGAWALVKRRLGSLIVLYLVAGALMLGVMVLAFLPMLLALAGDPAAGVAGLTISMALLFIVALPAFFMITMFQGIARAIIVMENVSFRAAFRRTRLLIKGRFWWSVLIVFVCAVLISVIAGIFQSVGQFGAIFVVLFMPESEIAVILAFVVLYGLTYIVSLALTYMYMGGVYALIYIDARMRHEGFDMDLARAAEARMMAGHH
ncbi:hypothetical protein ON058_10410 [Demequina sp. B12]|uniref:hypothetical protein n=1 Tax=Demequina sp. B12 TaxID=2992757 RepID=UPI00237BDA08|nr:hypothetical protein [Demequina sp. B12]MDE0573822.1 hypothetical protein [Demequina sp. B12]